MRKRIKQLLIPVALCVYLLAGCIVAPEPIAVPPVATNDAVTQRIGQQLAAGEPVIEIDPVDFTLPTTVAREQIGDYFRFGDLYFALVRQPSLNVPLTLPPDFRPTFTGLLISSDGAPWQPYLALKDQPVGAKNNPYYLWTADGALYLTVVDHLGAGSGEGNLKLLRLTTDHGWTNVGCYYFGFYSDPAQAGDYFAASRQLDRQPKQPDTLCANLLVEPL